MIKTAFLSYARMPEDALNIFKKKLKQNDIIVNGIASHKGEEEKIYRVFDNIQHYKWADYGNGSNWNQLLDINLYEKIVGGRKSSILPIVERYGPFNGGSLEAEVRSIYDFSRATKIIKELDPDYLFFAKEPESGIGYMLYLIGRYYQIPIQLTRRGIFGHSRTVANTIDTPLLNSEWKPSKGIISVGKEVSSQTINKLTEKEIDVIRDDLDYTPDYMEDKKSNLNLITLTKDLIELKNPKKIISFLLNNSDGPLFKYNLYKSYLNQIDDEVDFNDEGIKIYFPLHYQPELTTMPLGGEFVNQIKAIKLLSDTLPKNSTILVKEHLSIFSNINKANSNFRSSNYYNWLNAIPKVSLVKPDISSSFLQNKCHATATITGTAGFEAMLQGKPVLAFGNAFYLNGPGIYSIKDSNSLNNALNGLFNYKYDEQKVNKFLGCIDSICCHHSKFPSNRKIRSKLKQKFYLDTLIKGINYIDE